ncbi:hypothetical protein E0L32_012447, partial [Thyridium curvatum]
FLQRGDAGVGGLQHLHAVADAVEQVADVAGAGIETGRGEEVGRIVERAVDLLAGGQAVLRGGEQIGRRLQRKQVLTDR